MARPPNANRETTFLAPGVLAPG
ncbi:uncharacterized protein METZ01_LOCUS161374, partial [marine metagenome]